MGGEGERGGDPLSPRSCLREQVEEGCLLRREIFATPEPQWIEHPLENVIDVDFLASYWARRRMKVYTPHDKPLQDLYNRVLDASCVMAAPLDLWERGISTHMATCGTTLVCLNCMMFAWASVQLDARSLRFVTLLTAPPKRCKTQHKRGLSMLCICGWKPMAKCGMPYSWKGSTRHLHHPQQMC